MGALTLDLLARWLHLAGVVVWMGHNWSNVVMQPWYARTLPADAPREQIEGTLRAASRREHAVFRHASLVVLATGVFMLHRRHLLADALSVRGPAAVIGLGVWLGLAMIANLWLVLWPHQKKVLGFVPAPLEERLRCTRVTFLSSRTNTVLSVATLLLMVVGAHAPGVFSGR